MRDALQSAVSGARHFTDLIAWQLADQLRIEVFALTARREFVRDARRHSQTEDAVNSICRNIAEGFGCRSHAEFARFLDIANRSLNELLDSLRAAQLKRYLEASDLRNVKALATRLYPAIGRLRTYLRRTPSPHARSGTRRGQ